MLCTLPALHTANILVAISNMNCSVPFLTVVTIHQYLWQYEFHNKKYLVSSKNRNVPFLSVGG